MIKRTANDFIVDQVVSSITTDPEAGRKVIKEYNELLEADYRYDGASIPNVGLGVDFDGFVQEVENRLVVMKNPIAMFELYYLRGRGEPQDHVEFLVGRAMTPPRKDYYGRKRKRYPTWEEFEKLGDYTWRSNATDLTGAINRQREDIIKSVISRRYVDFRAMPEYEERLNILRVYVQTELLEAQRKLVTIVSNIVRDLSNFVIENDLWYVFTESVNKEMESGWKIRINDGRFRLPSELFAEAKIHNAGAEFVDKTVVAMEKYGVIGETEIPLPELKIRYRRLIHTIYSLVRDEYRAHISQSQEQ